MRWVKPLWWLAALLAALSTLGPFAIDTYLPAFDGISKSLGATPFQMQQTLSAYLLGFSAMLLWARYRDAAEAVTASVAAADGAASAAAVHAQLDAHAQAAAVPVLLVTLILLGAFGITGVMLARRLSRAADAIEVSLRAMAAGSPAPPRWASTDELGDLAASTATISREVRHVFEQLQAMAAGDLGRELEGVAGEAPLTWHRRFLHGVRTSGLPARLHPGFWDNDGRCCGTTRTGTWTTVSTGIRTATGSLLPTSAERTAPVRSRYSKSAPLTASELTVHVVWPLLPSVTDRLPVAPSATEPKSKPDELTVMLHAVAGSRPEPLSGTTVEVAAGSVLTTVRVPPAAPATVGAKLTGTVIEPPSGSQPG